MGPRMILAAGAALLLPASWISNASAQDLHRSCSNWGTSFDLVSNFEIVVQGQIRELKGLRFILDTGSSYSAIDRRVADRLGLDRRPGTVFSFDRNLPVEWAAVPEVRIGPMRIAGALMMVTSLADISAFAKNADGIIGLDVLSRAQKICIDYQQRRVSFAFDGARGPASPVTKAFVVSVIIQGISMHLVIDTGFEYMLLYKDRLHSALPHLRTEGEPRNAVIGHLQATQVNLPGIQISGLPALTPVLLIEGPGKAEPDGVDGYLGPAALHARRLELDFAGKTLRWQ